MKNKILGGVFLLALLLGLSGPIVRAEVGVNKKNITVAKSGPAVYEIKIIEQVQNNLQISFLLTNADTTQSNLKYGVRLVNLENNKILDEKLYDEKITLEQNARQTKTINYTAPEFLKGNVKLWVFIANQSAVQIGFNSVGEVSLTGSGDYLDFDREKCFLTIEGDVKNEKFFLAQGVSIFPTEKLLFNCDFKNLSNKNIEVVPNFKLTRRSALGDEVVANANDSTTSSFNPGEQKTIQLEIPKPAKPQAYDAKLIFSDKGTKKNASIPVVAHFVIAGESATIQELTFNKDSYKKDEQIEINFRWSGQADQFFDSRTNTDMLNRNKNSSPKLKLEMLNSKNQSCILASEMQLKNIEKIINLPIQSDCAGFKIKATLLGKTGEVLDEKTFFGGAEKKEVANNLEKNKTQRILFVLVGGLLLLFVIFYVAKKRGKFGGIVMIFLVLAFIAISTKEVDAAYSVSALFGPSGNYDSASNPTCHYGYLQPSGCSAPNCYECSYPDYYGDMCPNSFKSSDNSCGAEYCKYFDPESVTISSISLDKEQYVKGDEITLNFSGTASMNSCDNQVEVKVSYSLGSKSDSMILTKNGGINESFKIEAPSESGYITFTLRAEHARCIVSNNITIPFTVVAPVCKATCGTEGSFCLDPAAILYAQDINNDNNKKCCDGKHCYICNEGYRWEDSECVLNTCQGTLPENSEAYDSEESTNLTNNTTSWMYASSDTDTKCEYGCKSGFERQGSSCTSIGSGCLVTCANPGFDVRVCLSASTSLTASPYGQLRAVNQTCCHGESCFGCAEGYIWDVASSSCQKIVSITPTPTPGTASCNQSCSSSILCEAGLTCADIINEGKKCRLAACVVNTQCLYTCGGSGRVGCNEFCWGNDACLGGLSRICYEGQCRLKSHPLSESCEGGDINLTGSCDTSGKISLSWTGGPDLLNYYAVRINDTSNDSYSGVQYGWYLPSSSDLINDHVDTKSYTHKGISGKYYTAWVHSGDFASDSNDVGFTCSSSVVEVPTATITQTKDTTCVAEAFEVTWSSTKATSCKIEKTVKGTLILPAWATGLSGTQTATPFQVGTHVFTLTCTNGSKTATNFVTHTVSDCPIPTYRCTGTLPANTEMYLGDDVGLTSDTPYTYWATDTGTRCQYGCKDTYSWDGSSCVGGIKAPTVTARIYDASTGDHTCATDQFEIYWLSEGADKCEITKTINGGLPYVWNWLPYTKFGDQFNGSAVASPWQIGIHIYTLTCTKGTEKATDSISHKVESCGSSPFEVEIAQSRTSTCATGAIGEAFKIDWKSVGADGCKIWKLNPGESVYRSWVPIAGTYFGDQFTGSADASPSVLGNHIFTLFCTKGTETKQSSISHTVTTCVGPTGMYGCESRIPPNDGEECFSIFDGFSLPAPWELVDICPIDVMFSYQNSKCFYTSTSTSPSPTPTPPCTPKCECVDPDCTGKCGTFGRFSREVSCSGSQDCPATCTGSILCTDSCSSGEWKEVAP
jgi:hypothetical protein